jgi:hypothetical protein
MQYKRLLSEMKTCMLFPTNTLYFRLFSVREAKVENVYMHYTLPPNYFSIKLRKSKTFIPYLQDIRTRNNTHAIFLKIDSHREN